MTQPLPALRRDGRPAGEPLVWLTAMGLSLGLAMIVALLMVIVGNGMAVFWPKRVHELTLADGTVLLGEIVKARERRDGQGEEIQVFVGNRDAYGNGFRWLDVASVAAWAMPAGIVEVERTEYGDAIGRPVRLALGDGTQIPADDPGFRAKLDELVREVVRRRAEIFHLERRVIGRNSRLINEQEILLRRARRTGDEQLAERARAEQQRLKAEYERLAEEASRLRALQNAHRLVIRLADGRERRISLGAVVAVTWPNDMGFGERLAHALGNFWTFLSDNPREANTEGGIFPAIFGTFVMTLLMSIAVTPFGVLAAIYLREYAKQGPFVRAVRISINNLAGVPSIVFGVFGLGFFVYVVGGTIDDLLFADRLPEPTYGTGGILWASLTLALMTVPVVIVATEESIAAVPRGAREGSLALGASKWQTIQRIVLPAAVPGILTGLILAMARGAGEVAPLMLVGVVKLAPSLPIDGNWNATDIIPFLHLEQKFMHLGFHIYDLGFQSPDSDAAVPMVFATTFLLITLVVVLNLAAILMRERLRRKFQTGAF